MNEKKIIFQIIHHDPFNLLAPRISIGYLDRLVQERRNSIANALELTFFMHEPIDMHFWYNGWHVIIDWDNGLVSSWKQFITWNNIANKAVRLRQDGHHFPDDIFKLIFLNENVWISIRISPKFVPKCPINNIPALVQIMAWRRPGDKPSSEPMMVSLLTHICVTQPQWVNTHKITIYCRKYF